MPRGWDDKTAPHTKSMGHSSPTGFNDQTAHRQPGQILPTEDEKAVCITATNTDHHTTHTSRPGGHNLAMQQNQQTLTETKAPAATHKSRQ